jgi:RNA polymerase sigma factor (sigma-70 family)
MLFALRIGFAPYSHELRFALETSCTLGFPEGTTIPQSPLQIAELIRACAASENAEEWQAFVSCSHRQISLSILRVLRRWRLSLDIADDLVQETYLKLCADRCRLLYKFSVEYPHAVEGYIKTIAANVAQDYIRAQRSRRRGGGEVSQLPDYPEPKAESGKLGGEQAIQHNVLMSEIDRLLELCTDGDSRNRDRIIFWLHYQHGMTASAISTLPVIGLTLKGVESAIFRMTRQVRQGIARLQTQQIDEKLLSSEGFGRAKPY